MLFFFFLHIDCFQGLNVDHGNVFLSTKNNLQAAVMQAGTTGSCHHSYKYILAFVLSLLNYKSTLIYVLPKDLNTYLRITS